MPTFGRVAPTIYVRDTKRALDFYRDVLGFDVQFTNGISFAVIKQGDAQLHLISDSTKAGTCHAHIMVADVDELYAQLKQTSITIQQPPKVQHWGLKDIIVADPDGNSYEFASPVN